jgi:competence protein ComEA
MTISEILKYKWILIIVLALLLVIAFLYFFLKKDDLNTNIDTGSSILDVLSPNSQSNQPDCEIYVDVSGSINSPNVYCFKKGELVIDALKKAGGYIKDKSAQSYIKANINLARPLVANEKIYFPYLSESVCSLKSYILSSPPSQNSVIEDKKCININSSSEKELDTIIGIGPSTAKLIIENRPYKEIEDLKKVSGIGDTLIEKIKDEICL